jgi:hypothetical protein
MNQKPVLFSGTTQVPKAQCTHPQGGLRVAFSRNPYLDTAVGPKKTCRGGMRIADPSGVDELLQIIVGAEKARHRVIFFCACESPCRCHRAAVSRLLVKAARRKGIALTVVEWPGGKPEAIELAVSDKLVKDVLRGRTRVTLVGTSRDRIRKLTALAWCSLVRLRSERGDMAVISGPAQLSADWYLPVIGPKVSKPTDTLESLAQKAQQLRKSLGYLPLTAAR